MRNFSIRYASLVEDDLRDIYWYLTLNGNGEPSALKTLDIIISKIRTLSQVPYISPVRKTEGNIELRFAHARNYTIVYAVDSGVETVMIYAVINSRRNPEWQIAQRGLSG